MAFWRCEETLGGEWGIKGKSRSIAFAPAGLPTENDAEAGVLVEEDEAACCTPRPASCKSDAGAKWLPFSLICDRRRCGGGARRRRWWFGCCRWSHGRCLGGARCPSGRTSFWRSGRCRTWRRRRRCLRSCARTRSRGPGRSRPCPCPRRPCTGCSGSAGSTPCARRASPPPSRTRRRTRQGKRRATTTGTPRRPASPSRRSSRGRNSPSPSR